MPTITGAVLQASGFVATNQIYAGSAAELGWSSRSKMRSPSDGVVTLYNDANTDFARLQFGGTTSSFPSIRRATTRLMMRLADDSAYCGVEMATLQATTLFTTTTPGGSGTWKLGIANVVSPTSPNRTITVEVDGTTYYIHAKTTNN